MFGSSSKTKPLNPNSNGSIQTAGAYHGNVHFFPKYLNQIAAAFAYELMKICFVQASNQVSMWSMKVIALCVSVCFALAYHLIDLKRAHQCVERRYGNSVSFVS